MKTRHCHCQKSAPETGANNVLPPTSRRRRGGEIAGWIIPGITLVLMPKCPICVAAYVALFTGVSISFASASHLRTSLQVLCIATLLFLVMRRLYRILRTGLTQRSQRTQGMKTR